MQEEAGAQRSGSDAVVSRRLGGIVGPAMLAMLASEFPLVQPHLYDDQIAPVVYLSGTLLLISGLAIVRAHNRWLRNWTVLITLTGWFALVLGLVRMFAASAYAQRSASAAPAVVMAVEVALFCVGMRITVGSYWRGRRALPTHDAA